MKTMKFFKKPALLLSIVVLAVLLTVSAIAGAALLGEAETGVADYGEKYAAVQVATSGKVSLKFFYSTYGDATEFIAEVKDPVTNEVETQIFAVESLEETANGFCVPVALAPSQMTHIVSIYANGAQGAGEAIEYSVAQYAKDVLAKSEYKSAHDAMRALLNWGAFSQARFDDATSVLANTGLFERNTNSINGVNSISYSEGTVTHGTNIKGGTMNLSLEPNNIAIHFYVNYDGEGTLSATVSKNGEKAVPTEITKTDKGWLVRVANVPANMFDTPYTVTVTDGTGDTFTATKTVREYLGVLLAQCNATETDKNAADDDKAVAKASGKVVRAMYQLYQFTTGKTGAETCQHGMREAIYWIAADESSDYARCNHCHAYLSHQAIGDVVNDYIPGSLLQFGTKTGFADVTVMTEDGVQFVRVDNMWGNRDNWGDIGITNALSSNTVTGQYMIIKYRIGAEGNGSTYIEGFANTNLGSEKNLTGKGQFAIAYGAKDEWITAVIDLSARVKDPSVAFLSAEDGSYDVQYISLRLFPYAATTVKDDSAAGRYVYTYGYNKSVTVNGEGKETVTYGKYETFNGTKLTEEQLAEKVAEHPDYELVKIGKQTTSVDAYVDVAYIAFANDMADIKTLIDTKTYTVSVSNSENEAYNTADGSCAHPSRDAKEYHEGNTYNYSKCAQCGEYLYSKTVPESVSLYFSPNNLYTQQSSNSVEQKTTYDTLYLADKIGFYVDADNAYIRLNGRDSVAQWIWNRGPGVNGYADGNTQDYTVNVGKATHLVIKMKVTNTSETWGLQFSSAGVDSHFGHNLPTANMTSGEWTTVVIDLAKVFTTQYAANADGDYLIDTFYFHVPTFSDANNVDFAYFAFVEGGLNAVKDIVDTDTVLLQNTRNGVGYKLDPETCACAEHSSAVTIVDGTYKYACTVCDHVSIDYGVSADATGYFLPAEKLYDRVVGNVEGSSVTGKYNNISIETEDGQNFLRLADAETNHVEGAWGGWFVASTSDYAGTGRYMVIKVRQNDNSVNSTTLPFWITSVGSGTSWATGGFSVALPEDNQWHVIVVDLATRATSGNGFVADSNGEYGPRSIHVRPFGGYASMDKTTDEVIDIAYMAFFNDLNDLKNIVAEDTYEWSKTSTNSAVYDVETHKCAGAHDYAETVSGTTHTIACADCGLVANTFEVPADINYYADRSIMTHYGSTVTKDLYDEEAKIFYNKFYAAGGCHFDITGGSEGTAGSWTTEKYNSGKYVVIKYRSTVNETMYVGTKDHGYRTTDNNPARTSVGTLTASANWKVQVLEIPDNCATYTVNSEQELYFMVGSSAGTFELAYFAVVDSVTEAISLLGEGETFFLGNAHLDKNQKCVGVCNYVYTEDAEAENGYVYACSFCGTKNNSINWFRDTFYGGYNTTTTKNVGFTTFAFSASGHANLSYAETEARGGMPSTEQVVAGQYLAIKFRGTITSSLEIRIGNTDTMQANNWNYAMNSIGMIKPDYTSADEWRILIIDLSNFNDAEYEIGKKHGILLSTQGGIGAGASFDVAWVAVGDSIDEIKTLFTEDDTTYYDFGKSYSNAPTHKNLDGSCVNHNAAESVSGTTYTYTCIVCGTTVKTIELDSSVTKYYSANVLNTTANVYYGGSGNAYKYDADANVGYMETSRIQTIWQRMDHDMTTTQTAAKNEQYTENVGNAKYLVIKARSSDAAAYLRFIISTTAKNCQIGTITEADFTDGVLNATKATYLKILEDGSTVAETYCTAVGDQYYHGSSMKSVYLMATGAATGEWVTYVIDLEAVCGEYYAKVEGQDYYDVDTFYFHNAGTNDIAYAAFVEGSWAEIDALVEEDVVMQITAGGSSTATVGKLVNVADGSDAE